MFSYYMYTMRVLLYKCHVYFVTNIPSLMYNRNVCFVIDFTHYCTVVSYVFL